MILGEKERSIMEEVRDVMQMDAAADNGIVEISHYICTNIGDVMLAREGKPSKSPADLSYEGYTMYCALTSAISIAIGSFSTIGVWMEREIPGFGRNSADHYVYGIVLGRLAWLDKILETGEIA